MKTNVTNVLLAAAPQLNIVTKILWFLVIFSRRGKDWTIWNGASYMKWIEMKSLQAPLNATRRIRELYSFATVAVSAQLGIRPQLPIHRSLQKAQNNTAFAVHEQHSFIFHPDIITYYYFKYVI